MIQSRHPRETLRWWILGGILFASSYAVRRWLATRHAGGHPRSFSWLDILAAAGLAAAAIVVLILVSKRLRSLMGDKKLQPIPAVSSSKPAPAPLSYPCPSCGFLVFAEPPGSFDICEICRWEDDVVQLADPTYKGGANQDSLAASQAEILKALPIEIREHNGIRRDPQWRPLRDEDLHPAIEGPDEYWLRNSDK